jgi:hypothetical protein
MRILFLCLVLILAPVFLQPLRAELSPVAKGVSQVSGIVSYSHMAGDLYYRSGFARSQLEVNAGYSRFIFPWVAVGGKLAFTRVTPNEAFIFGLGPVLAVHFGSRGEVKSRKGMLVPYLAVQALLLESNATGAMSGRQAGMGGGISYLITRSVALTMEVNAQFHHWENENLPGDVVESQRLVYRGGSLNGFLGFTIYLNPAGEEFTDDP